MQNRDAYKRLLKATLRGGAITLFTGDIGCGKTMLIHALVAAKEMQKRCRAISINCRLVSSDEVAKQVLSALDAEVSDVAGEDLCATAIEKLHETAQSGLKPVIIVDEAQTLSQDAAFALMRIAGFLPEQDEPYSLLLVGQPEIEAAVARPEMEDLRHRIDHRVSLSRLSLDEVADFIDTRLQRAGYDGDPLFDPGALEVIHEYAEGVPRLVNKLCDLCLFLGAKEEIRVFGRDEVQDILKQWAPLGGAQPAQRMAPVPVAADGVDDPPVQEAPAAPDKEGVPPNEEGNPAALPDTIIPKAARAAATPAQKKRMPGFLLGGASALAFSIPVLLLLSSFDVLQRSVETTLPTQQEASAASAQIEAATETASLEFELLRDQKQAAERELNVLNDRVAKAKSEEEQIAQNLQDRQAELVRTEEELSASVATRDDALAEAARAQTEQRSLDAELIALRQQVTTLDAELASRETEQAALETARAEGKDELASFDAEAAEREERLAVLNADLSGLTEQLNALETSLAERQAQLEALEQETGIRQARLETLNADIASVQDKRASLDMELARQEKQVEALVEEETKVSERVTTLSADQIMRAQEVRVLEEQKALLEARLLELDTEREARLELLSALDTERTDRETQIAELDAAHARRNEELEALEAKQLYWQERLATLQADHVRLEQEVAALATARVGREEKLATLEGTEARRNAQLAALAAEISAAERTLEQATQAIGQTEREIAEAQDVSRAAIEPMGAGSFQVALQQSEAPAVPPRELVPALVQSEDPSVFFYAALDSTSSQDTAINYARGALRGHSRSARYLGQLFDTGDGLIFDAAMARRWYRVAEDSASLHQPGLSDQDNDEAIQRVSPLAALEAEGSVDFIWQGRAKLFTIELAGSDEQVIAFARTPLNAVSLEVPEQAALWRVRTDDGTSFSWQPIVSPVE